MTDHGIEARVHRANGFASATEHGARLDPSRTVRLRILRAIDEAEVLTDEHDARALAEALIPFIAAERADARGTA